MPPYKYRENVYLRDRFTQIQVIMDDGKGIVMNLGGTYDLTYNEYLRASQQVVLVPSNELLSGFERIAVLPVFGPLEDGDMISWSEQKAAFLPGAFGGGTAPGEVPSETADTFQSYRVILLSNGTVKAIPTATPVPATPTGVIADSKISRVALSWNSATASGPKYAVYRDGVEIAQVTVTTYRDINISVGSTYSYRIQTIDQYGQRSALSTAQSAFIDPASNVAPTVTVKAWPPSFNADGKTILRVNASDFDAQTLTLALSVDTGTITPTDDPSIWIYEP